MQNKKKNEKIKEFIQMDLKELLEKIMLSYGSNLDQMLKTSEIRYIRERIKKFKWQKDSMKKQIKIEKIRKQYSDSNLFDIKVLGNVKLGIENKK